MTKLNLILIKYKLQIVITLLFILGLYHLSMSLVKEGIFGLSEYKLEQVKFILIRFYHFSILSLIGFGFSFKWRKVINWIWLYIGFRLIYTVSLIIPSVKEILVKTLMDGLSFGILIIVILLVLRNE